MGLALPSNKSSFPDLRTEIDLVLDSKLIFFVFSFIIELPWSRNLSTPNSY
jgi:hypothetical protein